MTTGTPLISSFAISCQTIIFLGYAFATPSISIPNTKSSSFRNLSASEAVMNFGLSIDGIPSFGGPPENILSSGTVCFTPLLLRTTTSNERTGPLEISSFTPSPETCLRGAMSARSILADSDTSIFISLTVSSPSFLFVITPSSFKK